MKTHAIVALAFSVALGAHAAEAPYPNRPVRLVVSGVAGSSNFAARLIANGLSGIFGQQVVVDGREGGVIAAEIAARAAPDGYTLVMATNGTHGINASLYSRLPYDTVKDFAPITRFALAPYLLIAHPSLPVQIGRAHV